MPAEEKGSFKVTGLPYWRQYNQSHCFIVTPCVLKFRFLRANAA